MKSHVHMEGREGFTLVELLVVVMIIMVLALGALLGLRPALVKSSYGANVVPTLGLLRTKIELYRVENSYLPGLMRNADGSPVTSDIYPAGCSKLGSVPDFGTYGLQSFFKGPNLESDGLDKYKETILSADPVGMENTDKTKSPEYWENSLAAADWSPSWNLSDHFARCIDVNYSDLTAPKSWPNFYQYATFSGGYNGGYCYVIGGFSDGRGGMPAGTGVAFLEFENNEPNVQKKVTLKWERYTAVGKNALFLGMGDDNIEQPNDWKEAEFCYVPQMSALMSDDAPTVQDALETLRKLGWTTP